MNRVFMYSIYVIVICIFFCNTQEEKEVTLNQLFGIAEDSRRSAITYRKRKKANVLDIGSLTEDQFNKNFEALDVAFKDPKGDKEAVKEYLLEHINQTRRYWLPYKPIALKVLFMEFISYDWYRAQKHNNYAKTTDNILTLIYMARYKMKEIELHPLYNNKTPAYKIAFMYVKLRNLRRRIRAQWTRMENAYPFVYWEVTWSTWNYLLWHHDSRWYDPNVWMANHERIVALHTQFCYYWWILVRLHEATCNASHIYMTKPTPKTTTIEELSPPVG